MTRGPIHECRFIIHDEKPYLRINYLWQDKKDWYVYDQINDTYTFIDGKELESIYQNTYKD